METTTIDTVEAWQVEDGDLVSFILDGERHEVRVTAKQDRDESVLLHGITYFDDAAEFDLHFAHSVDLLAYV